MCTAVAQCSERRAAHERMAHAAMVGKETAMVGKETAMVGKEAAMFGKEAAMVGKETAMVGKETAMVGKETAMVGKETANMHAARAQCGLCPVKIAPNVRITHAHLRNVRKGCAAPCPGAAISSRPNLTPRPSPDLPPIPPTTLPSPIPTPTPILPLLLSLPPPTRVSHFLTSFPPSPI